MDAAHMADAALYEAQTVGAVISGLPILFMSPKKIAAILTGAFGYLRPGGSFYQFTYAPRCPVSRRLLGTLGLHATRIAGTFRNIPPAAVYRISRIGDY
jgi:phospholipid N-methyltransferase